MPDTVDPAAVPRRTLAQIIEGTGAALCVACFASRGNRSRTFISLRAGRHRGGVTGAPGKLEQAQGQWRVRLDGCLGERVCRSASAAAQRAAYRRHVRLGPRQFPPFRCPCGPGFMPASRGTGAVVF